MKIIGVTGNIAAGKSTISKIVAEACDTSILINVDEFSKNWVKTYEVAIKILFHKFGLPDTDSVQETIKKYLFINKEFRKLLEDAIADDFWEYIHVLEESELFNTIVVEHPIMFERQEHTNFNFIIGVDADIAARYTRMKERGYDWQNICIREQAQTPLKENIDKVDLLIDATNNPTKEDVIRTLQNSERFREFIP